MIGTFWNLCRACPSVPPVDKLHSEYRSTYRWHEYTGPRQEIIRRPPQNTYISQSNNEPNLHRRKKYPELAYRAHDFLVSIDNTGSDGLIEKTIVYDRARSEERWGASRHKSSRRSKSEGPPGEQPSYRLIYTKSNNVSQHKSRNRTGSYLNDENVAPPNTNQNENMRNTSSSDKKSKNEPKNETSEYRLQFAWPPANKVLNSRIDDIYFQHTPRKSISMNGIKSKGTYAQDTVPVHKKTHRNQSDMEVLRPLKPNTDAENVNEHTHKHGDEVDGEFKSEYRKNFQSFTKYDFDETKGFIEKQINPLDSSFTNENEIDSPSSTWYKEVVLLRKKANQYRYRGWGTELVPDHIAQVYTNQLMVWDQVSRRSSLSALALASTILTKDRSLRDVKERDNRKNSPTKSLTRLRSAKSSHDSSGNHESRIKQKNVANVRNISAKNRTECSPDKGNTRAKKSVVERSSPKNTSRNTKESNAPATIHSKVSAQGSEKPKRRPRPTSLVTSVPSGSKSSFTKKKDESGKQTLVDNKKGRRRTEAKKSEEPMVVSKEESEPTGEDVPDFPDVGEEQIVKSPPEPTRVKSPEQIVMRSPEPVNWTVPLDTGKTFTVTQNVHEGDLVPRSYSEARAWTPTSAPPPASISAPTELLELAKTKIPG